MPHPEVAEHINAWWEYSSEINYIGSSLGVSIYIYIF